MTDTAAVHASGLVKQFGDLRAVDGIDLEVSQGEILGVLGPNGAGKTTMLRMLATLLPIDAGDAQIFGVDVAREPHRVRQLIGVTGQYASVDENLTATENLWLFGRLQGMRSADARATARAAARAVRARGGRRAAAVAVLGRHAPAARPRGEPDHAAAADLPRRADHRPGPAHARPDVGHDPEPRRRGLHRPADDAVPRRGRPARRPHRGHRPRPQGRGGHAGRAQGLGRQLDAPAAARRRRRPGARLRRHPPRPRQRAGADARVRPHQRAARRSPTGRRTC